MSSKRSGTGKSSHGAQPQMVEAEDGYYYQEAGDGAPHFLGSDGVLHPVIHIQDMTGTFRSHSNAMSTFLSIMMQKNNSFQNDDGQLVEFTRAIVITGLHRSTAASDPYSKRGVKHFGIQLTNDSLFANDGSTHMYHFRPEQPDLSVFYAESKTRTSVAKIQNEKHKFRLSKGDKKDSPGGGAGASNRSSKGGSSKQASYQGSSSRTSAKGSSSKAGSSGGSSSKRHTSHHDLGRHSSGGGIQKKYIQPRAPQTKPLRAECKRLHLAYGKQSGENETDCLLDLVALEAVINALHEAHYFCDSTGVRNQRLASRCPAPCPRS